MVNKHLGHGQLQLVKNLQEATLATAWTRSSKTLLVENAYVLMGLRTREEHVLMSMSVLIAHVDKTRQEANDMNGIITKL